MSFLRLLLFLIRRRLFAFVVGKLQLLKMLKIFFCLPLFLVLNKFLIFFSITILSSLLLFPQDLYFFSSICACWSLHLVRYNCPSNDCIYRLEYSISCLAHAPFKILMWTLRHWSRSLFVCASWGFSCLFSWQLLKILLYLLKAPSFLP